MSPLKNESPLTDDAIGNPLWNALTRDHRHLAVAVGEAMKYRADVAPFAVIAAYTPKAMEDLRSLLTPGEMTYLMGEQPPDLAGLECKGPLGVLQMLFPRDAAIPGEAEPVGPEIVRLSCDDAFAMVELTNVAFPGFFRQRTCEMGEYYGIWQDGGLGAMGGERLVFNPYREISGVCTHPEHRGKEYATRIIGQLLRDHRRDGHVSWLHVASANVKAIALYERLGFVKLREVQLWRVTREA